MVHGAMIESKSGSFCDTFVELAEEDVALRLSHSEPETEIKLLCLWQGN